MTVLLKEQFLANGGQATFQTVLYSNGVGLGIILNTEAMIVLTMKKQQLHICFLLIHQDLLVRSNKL